MLKDLNKVLGMNARSSVYLRLNKKAAREAADNKLQTKQLLIDNGIATADLIAVIRAQSEFRDFAWETLPASFVIKPNRGLGGEGILVIFNRLKNGKWLTTNKRQLSVEDLKAHVNNILDGNYSLLDTPDVALFESRLSPDPLYKRFSSEGIPDIRVIVFNNVPVMAMLRVPTKRSGGKANLAQGGLGIGVDIATGLTTHVVVKGLLYEREIDKHPDTGVHLRGVRVPYWSTILKTALLSARVVGLKYAGVDISIDKKKGPVVLELNARPGLGIQVANMAPLRERLQRIKGLKVDSPERGIAIAKELFTGQLDYEVASITGRQVIGLAELVSLTGKEGVKKTVRAKVDTGADSTSIDMDLARDLGFGSAVDYFLNLNLPTELTHEQALDLQQQYKKRLMTEQPDIVGFSVVHSSHGTSLRIRIKLTIKLAGHQMNIEANVMDRSDLTYPMLVGRKNLSHFLIDTTKLIPETKQQNHKTVVSPPKPAIEESPTVSTTT